MDRQELIDWIWLAEAIGRSGRTFRKLVPHFHVPGDLHRASREALCTIPGIGERTIDALMNKEQSEAARILEACERLKIQVVPYPVKDFPAILRDITDPPVLLYAAGIIPDFERHFCVGMVGTRKMSEVGMQNAYRLSWEVSGAKALIISGLAEGIDGVCAVGAIRGGGKTVAVTGCGLDIAYPQHHGKLMNLIAQTGGVILSEYPPGTPPKQYHFPIRNRIISGLSQIVIVVEAGMSSGSLITAKEAFAQGRKVYTIPADPETHVADGNNKLLQDGAKVILQTQDIVERYRYVYRNRPLAERVKPLVGGADLNALKEYGVIEFDRFPEKGEISVPPFGNRQPATATMPQTAEKPKEPVKPSVIPDEVLQTLTGVQLAVLEAMPDDCPVLPEAIKTEFSMGEVMAALTVLEVLGIVCKLPGSMYGKT